MNQCLFLNHQKTWACVVRPKCDAQVMAVDRKLPEQDDQNDSVPLGQLFTSQNSESKGQGCHMSAGS